MDKCLITGSTGFIGSRLVKCLDDLNYDILVVSRNPQSKYKSIICDLQNECTEWGTFLDSRKRI